MTQHIYESADDCYRALESIATSQGFDISARSGIFAGVVLVASTQSHGPACYAASRLVLTGTPYHVGMWQAWF
jgi:hypothetical protein